MANLTKRELIVRISNEVGVVQSEVAEIVQKVLDGITESLAEGRDVELRNFGVFEIRLTKPRVGRNPKDPGRSYKIPARAAIKFKMGKVMRQKVAKMTPALKKMAE